MARLPDPRTDTPDPAWRLTSAPGTGDALVLRVAGEIDASACAGFEALLAARVTGATDVVVDLREVTRLSVAATGVLTRLADRLAEDGRRLLVVTGAGLPRRVLEAIHAVDVLEIFTTVTTATASLAGGADAEELVRLRAQVHDLREKLRTRPLVARALGVLQERYGLPDVHTANGLLREVSQRYNVKMRALAHAFLAATPPAGRASALWFPGRVRPPAPALTFAPRRPTSRAAFLDAVLAAALSCASTGTGDIQLVDPVRGGLALERHRGLSAELVAFFDQVGTVGSAGATALRDGVRVVVADVATDPVYTDQARALLLAAGSRAVQCTPLLARAGECVGVVSTHHDQPGRVPTATELAALDRIGAEAGAWLDWHTRTSTLDALEHLHRVARQVTTGIAARRARLPGAPAPR